MKKRKNYVLLIACFVIETCLLYCFLNNYSSKEYNAYKEESYLYLEDIARKIEYSEMSILDLPDNVTSKISQEGKYFYVTLNYNENEESIKKRRTIFEKLASYLNKVSIYLIYDSDGKIVSMKREFDSQEYMLDFVCVYAIFLGIIATFLTWAIVQFFKSILKPIYPKACIN